MWVIKFTDGRREEHETYRGALDRALEDAGEGAISDDQPDRTVIWENYESEMNDDVASTIWEEEE